MRATETKSLRSSEKPVYLVLHEGTPVFGPAHICACYGTLHGLGAGVVVHNRRRNRPLLRKRERGQLEIC